MHSLLSGQRRSHTRAIDLKHTIYVKRNFQGNSEVTLRHLSGLSSAASICTMDGAGLGQWGVHPTALRTQNGRSLKGTLSP